MSRAYRERRLIVGLTVTLGALLAGVALVLVEDARESEVTGAPDDGNVVELVIERPGVRGRRARARR